MSSLFTGRGDKRVKLRTPSAEALLFALKRLVVALDGGRRGEELGDWLAGQGDSLNGSGVCLNPLPPPVAGSDSAELLLRSVAALVWEMADERQSGYLNDGHEPLARLRWIARLRLLDELVREDVAQRSGDVAFPLVSDLVDSVDVSVVEIMTVQMTEKWGLLDPLATSEVFERLASMALEGQVGTRYPEFVIDLYMRLALVLERRGDDPKAASAVRSAAEWESEAESKQLMLGYADELG